MRRQKKIASEKTDFKAIMAIFIGLIITATLIVAIADQTFLATNTFSTQNETVTLSTTVNGTADLNGRELVGTASVSNATTVSGAITFITVESGTGSDGLLSVVAVMNDTAEANGYNGVAVNVTYDYIPNGYISDSGGRAITSLILIFAALAMVVFVIVVLMRGSLGDLIKRS